MEQITKNIKRFNNRCSDAIDDRSASSARALQKEVQRLEDEAQSGKDARSLENRAQSVISRLEQVGDSGAMSSGDVHSLIGQAEDFIKELGKMR